MIRSTLPLVVLGTLLALCPSPAAAQIQRIQGPAQRVTLVELFTSEGCSSCPPAERWLNGLADDPRLWHGIVPVAFHVDYWDYIGWPDRFASPAYAARQRAHARSAGRGGVYTPGFVVHGEEWRGWFHRPVLELDDPPPAGVITLDVDRTAQRVSASFVAAVRTAEALDLHLAMLGFGLRSEVGGGENAGRTLQHDFVVLGYAHSAMTGGSPRFEAAVALPEASHPAARRALAAWVSARGDPRPLQAVGGWLQ
jgi:hypothetical protein